MAKAVAFAPPGGRSCQERAAYEAARHYDMALQSLDIEVAAATSCTDALVILETWMRADQLGEGKAVLLGAHAYHGALSRYLGLAAGGLGRHGEAVELHESALGQHQSMRAPGWEARSRYDLAGALLARGESGDRSMRASCSTRSCSGRTSWG